MSYAGNEKLRRLLYAKIDECAGKGAGPEARRLLTLADLQRELDGNGVQVPGFSIEKLVKEWKEGSSDSAYTITCDGISGECFLRLEFYKNRFACDRASFYIRFYETKSQHRFIDESGISLIYRLLESFKTIAGEYAKLRGEIERGEKLRRLTIDSLETWLTLICKNISLPYHIIKMENQAALYLLLQNGRQLEIYIPYSNFQQVLPGLEDTIKQYISMQKDCAAKVLISNRREGIRWKNTEGAWIF
ncbi:MAG: hypothetical protein LBP37_04885 [Spirochaetaceae bacterium]|jgi:hypothetical protein|nr:hypothetical protein [Spirochaetaceae bacterium]